MYSPVLLELFNIGGPEFILILFVALLLFGGNKLPELARGLGKGIRDFKDASEGVKREIHNQINTFDEKPSEPEYRNNTNTVTETETETQQAVIGDEKSSEPETSVKKEY